MKDEFSFINPKAELELKAGVGLFFGCDIVIEKIGGPTFNIGPQVNLTGKLSYQMGDDRINASIEGKAGVGGEIGAKLKIFGFEIADWRHLLRHRPAMDHLQVSRRRLRQQRRLRSEQRWRRQNQQRRVSQ